MTKKVNLFSFQNADGTPIASSVWVSLSDADREAKTLGLRLVRETYELTESEVIKDYTSGHLAAYPEYDPKPLNSGLSTIKYPR